MPYNVEETGQLSRKAEVVVPRDEYQKNVETELRKLSGRVKVRGFRKGKIPMGVLKQRYGDAVQRDVVDALVNRYVDEILQKEEDVLFVSRPEVTKFDEDGVGLEFRVEFEIRPPIDPIGYLGVSVEKPRVEVESDAIDKELESLRKQFATLEPIPLRQTIKEGDVVTFDFAAVSDDPELAEFKGEDAQLTIGEGTAMPGIEDALIGAKFDATVRTKITPDENFPIESAQGKEIELDITIKSVKQRVLPELDDDFARDTGEAETLLELRQKIRESLAHNKEHEAGHLAEGNLIERLLDQNDFEIPPLFLRQQIDNNIRRQLNQLAQQGINPDELGLDLDKIREDLREETEEQIKAEFLLMAIAEKEKLEVGEQDLQNFFMHQAMHSGVTPEQLVRWYRQDRSRMQQAAGSALLEKTVNYLLEEADIKEVDWPTPEEQEKKAEERKAKKAAAPKKEKPAKEKKEKKAKEAKAEAAPAKEEAPKATAADATEAFEAMTVDELKELCRANDLKVGGKKSELVERLVEAGVNPV